MTAVATLLVVLAMLFLLATEGGLWNRLFVGADAYLCLDSSAQEAYFAHINGERMDGQLSDSAVGETAERYYELSLAGRANTDEIATLPGETINDAGHRCHILRGPSIWDEVRESFGF